MVSFFSPRHNPLWSLVLTKCISLNGFFFSSRHNPLWSLVLTKCISLNGFFFSLGHNPLWSLVLTKCISLNGFFFSLGHNPLWINFFTPQGQPSLLGTHTKWKLFPSPLDNPLFFFWVLEKSVKSPPVWAAFRSLHSNPPVSMVSSVK
jgi:hypothetical protein